MGGREEGVGRGLQVSKLLFADGYLLYCEVNTDHLLFIKYVLLCFQIVSCPKVKISGQESLFNRKHEECACVVLLG